MGESGAESTEVSSSDCRDWREESSNILIQRERVWRRVVGGRVV